MSVIHFIVTCAKAKRYRAPTARRLRSVRRVRARAAAELWVDRLGDASGEAVRACDLYTGDHWKAASEASAIVTAGGGRAWVASAGYGLIPFDAPIRPYSATFTLGDLDSVSRLSAPEGEVAQAVWWSAVAEWEGPSVGAPRLVADLAAEFPDDLLVAALSETYLRALTPDLLGARARLAAPDRLLVLCGGAPANHPLAGNLVRWDTRVHVVAGALTSMNARVARRLLQEIRPHRVSLVTARERVSAWAATAPSRVRPERQRVSDHEVRGFIRDRLASDPHASPTALHRAFRDAGLACERLRFLALARALRED